MNKTITKKPRAKESFEINLEALTSIRKSQNVRKRNYMILYGIALGFLLALDHRIYAMYLYILLYPVLGVSILIEIISLLVKKKLHWVGDQLFLFSAGAFVSLKIILAFVMADYEQRAEEIIIALEQFNEQNEQYPKTLAQLSVPINSDGMEYLSRKDVDHYVLVYDLNSWLIMRYQGDRGKWFTMDKMKFATNMTMKEYFGE